MQWTAWAKRIDFRLSARRDMSAAKRFFRKVLLQPHTVDPCTITVGKNPAYPGAVRDLKAQVTFSPTWSG